jgi:hypothetical protein
MTEAETKMLDNTIQGYIEALGNTQYSHANMEAFSAALQALSLAKIADNLTKMVDTQNVTMNILKERMEELEKP